MILLFCSLENIENFYIPQNSWQIFDHILIFSLPMISFQAQGWFFLWKRINRWLFYDCYTSTYDPNFKLKIYRKNVLIFKTINHMGIRHCQKPLGRRNCFLILPDLPKLELQNFVKIFLIMQDLQKLGLFWHIWHTMSLAWQRSMMIVVMMLG